VRSTHRTTLEITKEPALSEKGDCIVAVESSAGMKDLPQKMKRSLCRESSKARLTLSIDSYCFSVEGRGAKGLTLAHPTDIVIRKSGFLSDRTLFVHANRSAADIPRSFVELLRDPSRCVVVEISVES